MRQAIIGALVMIASLTGSGFAQTVPQIPYDSVPNLLKLPPNLYLGEVSGVAVNSKGHIFAFSRGNSTGPAYGAAAAQLLEFAGNGNFLREIGHNPVCLVVRPHGEDRPVGQYLGDRQGL